MASHPQIREKRKDKDMSKFEGGNTNKNQTGKPKTRTTTITTNNTSVQLVWIFCGGRGKEKPLEEKFSQRQFVRRIQGVDRGFLSSPETSAFVKCPIWLKKVDDNEERDTGVLSILAKEREL